MIRQCDEMVLQVLRSGLLGIIRAEDIRKAEEAGEKEPGITVLNTGFSITDSSIGGYGGVTYEDRQESFDTDGKKTEFTLETAPLRPLTAVEQPLGTVRTEPDDFTLDSGKGTIAFRIPPEKGKKSMKVQYRIARSVAEVIKLEVHLEYIITIIAKDIEQRDQLMLAVAKTLFDRRNFKNAEDLTEIRLVRGYLGCPMSPGSPLPAVLECQVGSSISIEIGLPVITRIDIAEK